MIKLLITDLDDTLYSWIGFFIPAFYGMVEELSHILGKSTEELLAEYKHVHQEKGSVEFPYSTMLLPSVQALYPNCTKEELQKELNPAFHRFNSIRKRQLSLYPNVKETLNELAHLNIKIVGYTESAEENGFYRLQKLGVDCLFTRVYVSESQFIRPAHHPSSPKTQIVQGKKPNPRVLVQICNNESIRVEDTIYIGDSLTKDIYMAELAGITSVLCKYPVDTEKSDDLYQKLVVISNWTEADFENEIQIKELCQKNNIHPDYTVDSFEQIIPIIQSINNMGPQDEMDN